jgi:hypothetical protein
MHVKVAILYLSLLYFSLRPRDRSAPPAPGRRMVGGSRLTGIICRAPLQVSEGNVLRQRCDARGVKPLPIEIIARQKVAPAFEPQKVSRRTAPPAPGRRMVGGSRLTGIICRAPLQVSEGNVLRQRCPRPWTPHGGGGSRLTGIICRAPLQVSEGNVLRQRCDARGVKPLPIEIIARQKVAPAFEPQKVSRRTAPASECNAMDASGPAALACCACSQHEACGDYSNSHVV